MANKKFWLGMLVLVLTFGMTVVGCDDDSKDGNDGSLDGAWWPTDYYSVIYVITISDEEIYVEDRILGDATFGGTIKYSGSTFTVTMRPHGRKFSSTHNMGENTLAISWCEFAALNGTYERN